MQSDTHALKLGPDIAVVGTRTRMRLPDGARLRSRVMPSDRSKPQPDRRRRRPARDASRPARPARPAPDRPPVELRLDGITHGGEAVGRLPDGKACFVPYAIPGERVRVRVVEERASWARGEVLEVLDASPDRVEAPCPYFGPGRCGGCQLQHVDPAAQPALKRRVVTEQLTRIGRLVDPPVAETIVVAPFGYRTTARFAVDPEGRLGFRRSHSHDVQPVDRCLLLVPEAQALRDEAGDGWTGVAEVTVRAGLGDTGALLVRPGSGGLPALPDGDAAVAIEQEDGAAVPLRGDPTTTAHVAGRDLRVSVGSFFQVSVAGATVLAGLVRDAAAVRPGDTALDLHTGVGLFAGVLAAGGASVTGVERSPAAAADARANLADLDVEVVTATAEEHVAGLLADGARCDVVVLDPPRRGAGVALCGALAALGPRAVVYVSCDPAALARDARALADVGYVLERAVPVDQFAQTAQIETVATFRPATA